VLRESMYGNLYAKELVSMSMRKDLWKIALFGAALSFVCISSQDAQTEESKEMTMSSPRSEAPTPDQDGELPFRGRSHSDDYDYDVYTQGECPDENRSPCERDDDDFYRCCPKKKERPCKSCP